jgi:hypothetical protein
MIVPKFLPLTVTMPPPGWAALMPVIEGQEPPPQAAQLCRWIVETDWASSFNVFVADSLQREELGEIGTVSNATLGVENDDPVDPDVEEETKGTDEETESDAATVTMMGRAVVLMWGTVLSCKEQVRAC